MVRVVRVVRVVKVTRMVRVVRFRVRVRWSEILIWQSVSEPLTKGMYKPVGAAKKLKI